ncbi:MAG: CopG family transcriptional regulator [Deltaproteobacteria bacterium]|nr:CopG family transcriptional regulator [Deltaproteobacteria bacterium]MBW1794989.1 CopG family transcriptional regulator [Deltaproteobacteria bacterium]MBW2330158.1 CopG family transcriptional regulator [Deltaproteobacteria bacterium]
MPQIAIYIDDKLSKKLNKAIKVSGKSRSKWVADLIEAKLQDEWPEDFFELAGSWEGEETPEEIMATIRKGLDQAERREDLS